MFSNTVERRIEWGDCDPAGIVFNPKFFSYFDHCTSMLYEAAGWPKLAMLENFGVAGCPLVKTAATFFEPCSYGDDISITSSIVDVGRTSFDVKHELYKGGRLCVEGNETRVWTIINKEAGRLKSAPIPAEIAKRFRGG